MNEFKFYGTVDQKPELSESNKGFKYCSIILNVKRNYKNQDGSYDSDKFKVVFFKNAAEEVYDLVGKGTKVIVSGRIQDNSMLKDNNEVVYRSELIGERIQEIN